MRRWRTKQQVHFALADATPVDMMDNASLRVDHIPTGATTNGSILMIRDKGLNQTLIYSYTLSRKWGAPHW
jgi:hypothetical protein